MSRSTLPMQAYCPACGVPALVFRRSSQLVCESCFRPDPSEGRGVSGRKISPARAGDGGEASAPLSSLGLPANPSSTARHEAAVGDMGEDAADWAAVVLPRTSSGDIPSSVKESGGVRHRVPGPFDGDC